MAVRKICPRCGIQMMKKMRLSNGKFTWFCESCGIKRGEFYEDMKKGVV